MNWDRVNAENRARRARQDFHEGYENPGQGTDSVAGSFTNGVKVRGARSADASAQIGRMPRKQKLKRNRDVKAGSSFPDPSESAATIKSFLELIHREEISTPEGTVDRLEGALVALTALAHGRCPTPAEILGRQAHQ